MATAWKSASAAESAARRRTRPFAALVLAAGLASVAAPPAGTAGALGALEGHLAVGYAKLLADDSPAGSLSFATGLDLPIVDSFRGGLEIGVSLLGTRTEIRGSLSANIDYSTFEAYAVGHWIPPEAGPLGRVTAGAGLMSVRAEISSAGGGAAFLDLAREELVPAMALQATLMPRGPSDVRAGIELGARFGFLEEETWTIAAARLAVYY